MSIGGTLLLIALAGPSDATVLDAFDYADSAAAQAAWAVSSRTPPVVVQRHQGRNVLVISAPLKSSPDLPRTVMDRDVELNLAGMTRFLLDIEPEQPVEGEQVSLYFRSGRGWYAGSARLTSNQRTTLVFERRDFRPEDQPAGWDRIDGIRISIWRSPNSDDNRIRCYRLAADRHDIAIVVPESEDGENRLAHELADRWSRALAYYGVAADRVTEREVAAGALGDRPVAVVPYLPSWSLDVVEAVSLFVDRGGRVWLNYNAPAELMAKIGFRLGSYWRPDAPGVLSEIRLTADDVPGMPESVQQASWNIYEAEPIGANARIIGRWYDKDGRSTGKAALLVSDRGVYFSHVLLGDDWEHKRALIAALHGRLDPRFWRLAAAAAMERADRIGHCRDVDTLRALVMESGREEAVREWDEGERLLGQAAESLKASRPARAFELAGDARQRRVQAYLMAAPSRVPEGRAFWNHSGTGAYPGDWERTARELASAGINMVFPNMLWAGRAHYASDVLPRSSTFQQYGDQIEQCVAAAHRHGIEVHVWKVNFNLSGAPAEFVERLRREGRLQVDVHGQPTNWLNPAHPHNQKLEVDSLLEVVRRYPVDGIHFDYIRYPNGNNDYSDFSRKQFETDTGHTVKHWPADCYDGPLADAYRDWRCDQITRLVETVHREAKKIRPEVKISAAVFGAYPDCRRSVGQDWALWVRRGYLDFVCPMDYTGEDKYFERLVRSQRELVGQRIPLYPGIGATASRVRLTPDRVVGQILLARQLGADGFTIFNLTETTAREILPALARGIGTRASEPVSRP